MMLKSGMAAPVSPRVRTATQRRAWLVYPAMPMQTVSKAALILLASGAVTAVMAMRAEKACA